MSRISQGAILICRLLLGLLTMVVLSVSLTAQTLATHPELFVEVQDSIFIERVDGTDTIPANSFLVSASYQYEMAYDSTCQVSYLFSECRHNSVRPRLLTWLYRRSLTAPISVLNDSSRTDTFTVATGDTVSFYREFRWYNPKTRRQDTDNFHSPDTLDYAVELINAANGERLALLDSLGVLAKLSPGVPVLYGSHPIVALVKYAVPSEFGGKNVFVHIKQSARGDGLYNPVRLDMPTVGVSKSLQDSNLGNYLLHYGGGLEKRALDDFNGTKDNGAETPALDMDIRHISSDEVSISFGQSIRGGSVSIVVYDALGNAVFIPFSTRLFSGAQSVFYRFPSTGTYFVALMYNDAIAAVQKVAIVH